jgi:hypothetical protein
VICAATVSPENPASYQFMKIHFPFNRMSRTAQFLWVFFTLAMLVYLTMILWTLPHLRQAAGGRLAFDLQPTGYQPAEARALVAALGAEGRAFYLNVQHRLDTAYPALLAVALALAFRLLARGCIVWALTALAVLAAAFDYLENMAVAVLLRAGPESISDAMVESASRWTQLKSSAASVALFALIILLVRAGWIWVRQRR